MTEYEIDQQIERLEDAFGKKYTEGFANELKHIYITYSPERFRSAITHVIKHSKYLPRISAFHDAMEATAKSYADENPQPSCENCTHGFIRVYLRNPAQNVCYESNEICRKCRPNLKVKKPKEPRTELSRISFEEYLDWTRNYGGYNASIGV